MNRDEILNMPACRELDAIIAKEVLGCNCVHKGGVWICECTNTSHGAGDCDTGRYYIPQYSSNTSSAFQVARSLEEHQNEILLSLSRKGTQHDKLFWAAKFRECGGSQKEFYAEAETASLAICRAALLAVAPR